MKISYTRAHETIIYAATELKRYVEMMDSDIVANPRETMGIENDVKEGICLGLLEDFGFSTEDVKDAFLDDVIEIRVENGKGIIAGSNERSVLQGVYIYLKSAGCMWPRPGADGEFIPKYDISNHNYTYRKKADYPFRCQMMEGALKFEYICDAVMWMPKVGFNMFFIQFVTPYNFYLRWYKHLGNTKKSPEPISYQMMEQYTHFLERLAKKCGLMLHSVGHGYLYEPYGVRYYGPTTASGVKYEIPDRFKQYAALVKGKRDVFANSINFTQLCYSNPQVRHDASDFLVFFLQERPYIDVLQVYLADALGNSCECDVCTTKRPSDWYVMFLNELDEKLTAKGIKAKIAVDLYVYTYWAPVTEKLNNPDRFYISIGLSRTFGKPLNPDFEIPEIPEYKHNAPSVPSSFENSLAFFKSWENTYKGNYNTYCYDSYSIHYADPGLHALSELTSHDIKVFPQLQGIEGIVSCQTQRIGFPSALPNCIMGETLFDISLDFDEYADAYYTAAYGSDGIKVKEYLKEISYLFDPERITVDGSVAALDTGTGDAVTTGTSFVKNPESQRKLKAVAPLVDEFKKIIEKNASAENVCHNKSWELISYHGTYCKKLADFYLAISELNKEKRDAAYKDIIDWLSEVEDVIGQFFDFHIFKNRRLDVFMGQNHY